MLYVCIIQRVYKKSNRGNPRKYGKTETGKVIPVKRMSFDSTAHDLRLHIMTSGYSRCNSDWRVRELAVPFGRLYIPDSGEGFLQTGGVTTRMLPGYAYLLPPEVPISYWCPQEMVIRFFHLELMTPDHKELFRGTERILQIPVSRQTLDELIELRGRQSYYACLKLKQLLYALLVDLYQQLSESNDPVPTFSDHVKDTVSYIHSHLSAQLTVEELAQRRKISHTTLNKYFRRELGMSVGQYIDDRLLAEARSQLCHSSRKVSEISTGLGFSDPFYFSNKFKARTGYTPLQYRKVNGWRRLDK